MKIKNITLIKLIHEFQNTHINVVSWYIVQIEMVNNNFPVIEWRYYRKVVLFKLIQISLLKFNAGGQHDILIGAILLR